MKINKKSLLILLCTTALLLPAISCGKKSTNNSDGASPAISDPASITDTAQASSPAETAAPDLTDTPAGTAAPEQSDTSTDTTIPSPAVLPDETVPCDFRRPISPEQPMWLVHIDTWNYADPQKIIDLIPEDIRPFVVFNISLSISWDHDTDEWLMVQNGYETAKSWLRTCADNRVWAMIQPASGGQCHFPDYDDGTDYENTLFAEFFRDYPNFLGFNYCEQFWGFGSEDFPTTPEQRYAHFARLLEVTNRYGGYLVVSWCGNQWSPKINPLAMLKRVPSFEAACRKYSPNFILCEKYTQTGYLSDMESLVLGAYLSGYCGQFGVRYDESGWTDPDGDGHDDYRLSTSLAVDFERFALNGMTVVDGPELIWVSDFHETQPVTDKDGYLVRTWERTPEFENVAIDLFRKVLDGTIRIPSREEVIARTKVILLHDLTIGSDDEKYSTPNTLFEGLYRAQGDGNLRSNHSFYKSTGRYPSIPIAYALRDDLARSFACPIPLTNLQARLPQPENSWFNIDQKLAYFNALFPEEYTGDLYAGRYQNTWVTYNPYKEDTAAQGLLDCKYNTCEKIELTYSRYTSAILNEYADHLDFYINNYDEKNAALKENIIRIYGCASEPSYSYRDRGNARYPAVISSDWTDGVFTLTIRQNGPVDLTILCAGSANDRLTDYSAAVISAPDAPAYYTGAHQYEAEHFDCKNVEELIRNGCRTNAGGYQGQGYLKFGAKKNAAVKETVTTGRGGIYTLKLRYSALSDAGALDLYVNGVLITSLSLPKTGDYSSWALCDVQIPLVQGANTIELKASAALADSLYLDNFVLEGTWH